MSRLEVSCEITIDAPADVVRAQFGDVAHHAAAGVHPSVEFSVIEETPQRCHYRQTTSVGPLRLRQEMMLARTSTGPLVNEITRGQFSGGSISFDVRPVTESDSLVTATLVAELGVMTPLRPLLRRTVRSALQDALLEDKRDLESGAYLANRS